MKRRTWTIAVKPRVVLADLQGQPVAEVCDAHGISQSQCYLWRDQFLARAGKAFETEKVWKKQMRLEGENRKLKALVGALALELKKSEDRA